MISVSIFNSDNFSFCFAIAEVRQRIGDDREFRRKCDVVNDHHMGRRVLHQATEMGHLEICKFLVEIVGVNINVLNDRGLSLSLSLYNLGSSAFDTEI